MRPISRFKENWFYRVAIIEVLLIGAYSVATLPRLYQVDPIGAIFFVILFAISGLLITGLVANILIRKWGINKSLFSKLDKMLLWPWVIGSLVFGFIFIRLWVVCLSEPTAPLIIAAIFFYIACVCNVTVAIKLFLDKDEKNKEETISSEENGSG